MYGQRKIGTRSREVDVVVHAAALKQVQQESTTHQK